MKAVGVVGSPRKGGNTEILTKHALQAIKEEGIETELVRLAGMDIRPCNACMVCREEERCPIDDDLFPLYRKLKKYDAIILATPVYFGSVSAQVKAFMDRAGYIAIRERVFAGKVGGPLVVGRRAGHTFAFAQLMLWFHLSGFYMPGSTYFNVAFGRNKGEVKEDQEGLTTAWNFGKNIAFLVKKLKA
jgi:multimeric flavodoxin WrbA